MNHGSDTGAERPGEPVHRQVYPFWNGGEMKTQRYVKADDPLAKKMHAFQAMELRNYVRLKKNAGKYKVDPPTTQVP
jgi:hypothetical protein